MPRRPNPVRPRRIDERAYESALRRTVLAPLMQQLREGLTEASAASMALDAVRRIVWDRGQMELLVEAEVAAFATKIEGYHSRRLAQTFRTALGIDVRPLLSDAGVRPLLNSWRRENVGLIRTIPDRIKDGLYNRMTQRFAEAPFDQKLLSDTLRDEFKSSGYNLRRITRDQTSKAVGRLTQARHTQMGIEEYLWRASQDERVRSEHNSLDNSRHRWDNPPSIGHPGEPILCRCVATPVIPETGIKYSEGADDAAD